MDDIFFPREGGVERFRSKLRARTEERALDQRLLLRASIALAVGTVLMASASSISRFVRPVPSPENIKSDLVLSDGRPDVRVYWVFQ